MNYTVGSFLGLQNSMKICGTVKNCCCAQCPHSAYMPTLPDYPGVSRIEGKSPGLPYGSHNLPDKIDF